MDVQKNWHIEKEYIRPFWIGWFLFFYITRVVHTKKQRETKCEPCSIPDGLTCRVLIYNNESLCVVFRMLDGQVTCWTSQIANLDNFYNPRKTNAQNKTKTKKLMKCSQIYRANLSVIVKLTCAQRLLKRSHFLSFLHELVESLKMKGSTWDLLSVTHSSSLLFTLLGWRCI